MTPPPSSPGSALLRRSGLVWYLTAAVGQLAFVWMIAHHYGGHTLRGDYPGWNDKPIIKGYVAGDTAGNIMFAAHVLLAAVITISGLMQLTPQIRQRLPALHRLNGRLFLVLAYVMALGGLWLGWVRGAHLSTNSDAAVTLNGVLILIFVTVAWRLAPTQKACCAASTTTGAGQCAPSSWSTASGFCASPSCARPYSHMAGGWGTTCLARPALA